MVAGSLSGYALQSLVESAMVGAVSVTVRLFGLLGAEFDEASRVVRMQLAPLVRRGVAVDVICA
jgi:hypothetical protein